MTKYNNKQKKLKHYEKACFIDCNDARDSGCR